MDTNLDLYNHLLDALIRIPIEEVGEQGYLDVAPSVRMGKMMASILTGGTCQMDVIGMLCVAVDRLTLMDIGQRMA